MCQSNIHIYGRTQGFSAEHCPRHHIASTCQVSGAHTPGHPQEVKENTIYQTRAVLMHVRPDWSVAMQPYMQQTAMLCVFWHLCVRTSINFFSYLSYSSSSVGSNHTSQALFRMYINDPVTGSTQFLHWTVFDTHWPLWTGNTPQELKLWKCCETAV